MRDILWSALPDAGCMYQEVRMCLKNQRELVTSCCNTVEAIGFYINIKKLEPKLTPNNNYH